MGGEMEGWREEGGGEWEGGMGGEMEGWREGGRDGGRERQQTQPNWYKN